MHKACNCALRTQGCVTPVTCPDTLVKCFYSFRDRNSVLRPPGRSLPNIRNRSRDFEQDENQLSWPEIQTRFLESQVSNLANLLS